MQKSFMFGVKVAVTVIVIVAISGFAIGLSFSSVLFVTTFIGLASAVFVPILWAIESDWSEAKAAPPQSLQDLDQEAARFRAEKRWNEAMTERELAAAELVATRKFINEHHKRGVHA